MEMPIIKMAVANMFFMFGLDIYNHSIADELKKVVADTLADVKGKYYKSIILNKNARLATYLEFIL